MGAGVSVANNAAQAVASAVSTVVNNTNVFNEQSNTQNQNIVLNACDIIAKSNVDINQTTGLQQSLTQIATIASTTTVSNDVAQALSQAAASQVGAGVLGVADASNMASTYASMATNVSNYVQLSAKQLSKTDQTFECNNSTIVGNNITISQVDIDDVTQFTNDNVSNSTDVTNKIQQTIEQTASATTGFSIGGIIALIVALAVIALAVKMFSKPNNPNNPNQTHSQRILNAVQQGQTHDTVADLDNVRVSKATWIIYGVMIVLFGLVICAWYVSAGMQGCLFDDACGTRVGAVGGCSCNFNESGDGTNVCKDTTSASFTSTGIPLKYQYVLPFRQAQSVMCASAGSTSTASMQGILVSYFKTQSMTINANNGKNLDTLLRYVQMCAGAWPNDKLVPSLTLPSNTRAVQSIVNMFRAGAKYLATLTDASASMKLLTSCLVENDDNNFVQSGIRLALMCCPLRPVFVTTPSSTTTTAVAATWPNINLSQTCLTVDTTDATSVSNWTSSADLNGLGDVSVYLVRIPQAFTSVIPPDWSGQGQDTNSNAGCCSTRMVWYMDSTADSNDSFDFTCGCGDATSSADPSGDPDDPTTYYTNTGTFCNGCAKDDTSCAPPNNDPSGSGVAGATKIGQFVDSQTGQVKMKLPGATSATLPGNCTSGGVTTNMLDAYPLTATLADNWGLQYYAELATFNFGSDEDAQQAYSFVRLMWTGIMAAIGDQPADTVFGTNCMLVNPGAVDHYYVADQTGQGFGKVASSLDDQAGMVDDKTLLRIKLMNASKYDCKLGLPPVACTGIGDTGQTQSYIGSSSALGYCRDWFLNDYSRIVMFVLAALAVIWLPMFVVVRIYINRGTGKILVQDAQAHLRKSGESIMVAPFVNGHAQPDQHERTTPIVKHSSTSPDSKTAKTISTSPDNTTNNNTTNTNTITNNTNTNNTNNNTNNTNTTNTNTITNTELTNSASPTSTSDSDSPSSSYRPRPADDAPLVAPFVDGNPQPGDSPLAGGQSRPNKRRPAWLSLPRTAKR